MNGKRQAFSANGSSVSRLSANSRRQSKRKLVRLQRQRCINDEQSSSVDVKPKSTTDEYWIGVAPLLDMTGTARVLACKAANISSAMLAHRRKSSALTALGGTLPSFGIAHKKSSAASTMASPKWQQQELFHTIAAPAAPAVSSAAAAQNRRQTARESVAVLAENWNVFTMDPTAASVKDEITDDLLCCMGLFEFSLKLACLASMVSVCLHTPHTTNQWPTLHYWLMTTDIICTAIFSLDALLKINSRASLRDRWCQFDLVLLLFHYLSICVHCAELIGLAWPWAGINYKGWWGTVRSPRPFIMIKFIRSVIRFKLPKNRIQLIMKRSSQQIQNVTIFFLFFMTLYAIMGVQLFGRMEYHCVLHGTNPNNVTIADLAIPDTMCSPDGQGYECPPTMECMKLSLRANQIGFYGMFNDFASSLFTVYMAASQEGWVFVFYDTLDTFPSYFGFFYFITLIFFLAWLVKNVFIAVITETFAEIRVQFSEMWQSREVPQHDDDNQTRLERDDEGDWRLREFDSKTRDMDSLERLGIVRKWLHILIRSTTFQTFFLGLVVVNALVNASFVYRHNKSDIRRKRIYYWFEVSFTIIFCIEALIKMLGLGWRIFWRRGQYKFELMLCLGSLMNIVPALYPTNYFTYFQVFRLLRLVKLSPMLEDFVYKIFGPGKKLGGLILFTLSLVMITSAISLQLFCYVPNLDKFRTFPQAFMSMFQIITQEGWTDVVVEILRSTNEHWVPFVAIYFVGYHLFVTLIVLSLFVAVILDNLEMDEELKKIKQLKAREETTTMRTQLPWRLRIFEKFPTRPQMIELRKISREFPVPKVRDSFTRQFFDNLGIMAKRKEEGGENATKIERQNDEEKMKKTLLGDTKKGALLFNARQVQARQIGQNTSKKSLADLVDDSNKQRSLLSDSSQQLSGVSAWIRGAVGGFGARRRREQNTFRHHSQRPTAGDHLKENGDIRPTDTAPKEAGLKTGLDAIDIKALQRKRAQAEFTRNRIEEEMRENHPFFDSPLFIVGRDSTLRRWCLRIVEAKYNSGVNEEGMNGSFRGNAGGGGTGNNQGRRPLATFQPHQYKQLQVLLGLITYLDWTMVLVTAFSCAAMLFESPWPITGENMVFKNSALKACDFVFVFAMTLELTLKIIAHGLFFTPNAVVRDVGGFMTLFIYASSFWYLTWMPDHVEENSWAQLLMICRAMRPLRIYTLVPHIRRVVVELCKGFREILLVTILLVLFMFMFASFGLQFVGGKLAACNDASITSRKNCTGLFEQKLFVTRMEVYGKNDEELHPKMLVPRVWTNPRNFNFDHIGNAMLALFETLSYKGWNVIRDILWARQGPWAVFFIHVYVFIGCMIGLTLFVDVVIANYMENRGTALLTVDQRRWHDLKARLRMAQPLHVPPRPAESARIRNRLYELSMCRVFKQFYAILVVLNSATLAIPWSVEEEERRRTLLLWFTSFSALCICLFTLEILLKSIAFTPLGFWQSHRNRIDLLITSLGICWVVAHFGVSEIALPSVSVPPGEFRRFSYTFGYIVGILRFFTIAGRKSTLKMLMLTVVWSMVRSAFIIAAMFLLVLFYAYTGVILFGTTRYGQALSKHVNFRSGKHALMVLFRSITGEDWNDIMHDCMRSHPNCYWGPGLSYWQTDCGNYVAAILYFCSFYLIITYIVLNLLVAVIMENFSLFYSSEEDALLSYADIRNYQQVWNMVDLEQKHTIPVRRVKFLLRLLKGRLEVDPNRDRLLFKHMCHEMDRLNNGEDVSFHDILSMLSYRSVDIRKSLQLEELVQREELEYMIEEEVAKQTIRSWIEECLRRIKQQQRQREQGTDLIAQIRASMAASGTTPNAQSPQIVKRESQGQQQNSPSSPINIIKNQQKKRERSESTGTKMGGKMPKESSSSGGNGKEMSQILLTDPARKVDKRRRSSSIPELVEEAKRFVWGGRLKSLPRTSLGRQKRTAAPISEETGGGSSGTGSSPSQQQPDRPTISIVSELMAKQQQQLHQIFTQQPQPKETLNKRQSVTIRRNHNNSVMEEKSELSPATASPLGGSLCSSSRSQQRLSPTVIAIHHQNDEGGEDEENNQRRISMTMSNPFGKTTFGTSPTKLCANPSSTGSSIRSTLLMGGGMQQSQQQQQQQPVTVETVMDWWSMEENDN